MLQVVCNQRDRFKQRIAELEKENKELQHKMDTTNNEMKSLKNDNIKLYEKIKYLQSYGSISQGRVRPNVFHHTSSSCLTSNQTSGKMN